MRVISINYIADLFLPATLSRRLTNENSLYSRKSVHSESRMYSDVV